jgi:hypothetical protein
VRLAIDWLARERSDQLRYAAVLILREMAENAPAIFNVHVQQFIDVIWAGLRDAKLYVREASVDALRVSQHVFLSPAFSAGEQRRSGRPAGPKVLRTRGFQRKWAQGSGLHVLQIFVRNGFRVKGLGPCGSHQNWVQGAESKLSRFSSESDMGVRVKLLEFLIRIGGAGALRTTVRCGALHRTKKKRHAWLCRVESCV